MGYTHFWDRTGTANDALWDEVIRDVKKIFRVAEAAGIEIREESDLDKPPGVDANGIFFNGKGDDGHETFWFPRDDMTWAFCKTARKPYDTVVTAVLMYLADRGLARPSSDGDRSDWEAGSDLLALALMRRVPVPASVE